MSGDRPPWTQRTAPDCLAALPYPLLDPVAPVPVPEAPLALGVRGELLKFSRDLVMLAGSGGLARGKRLMICPRSFRTSISSSSSSESVFEAFSDQDALVGERSVEAPVTRAPRAR